jgi:DNA-binding GntR family transcriptional regulator
MCGFTQEDNIHNIRMPTGTADEALLTDVEGSSKSEADSAERRNITEVTFHRIRELIVHGRLAPGSRVVEADLADRLGVSRTPVRASLHRLQQEGYIQVCSGGKGKIKLAVAPLTQEDARELYSIVGHLEGLAGRSAARLEPEERIDVIRRLTESNGRLRELAEAGSGDPNVIFELDIGFHQTITDAGAGHRLRAMHSGIKPQTERYWRLYASSIVDQLGLSVGEHDVIIDAITRGDCDAAERALQMNWQNGSERLSRVIATLGERGSW